MLTRTVYMSAILVFLASTVSPDCLAQTREEKVRADKQRVEAEGIWLYNDLEGALKQAKATGKPIAVALRCIPCEECVKLDDDLVDNDPEIKPLLEKFVCVRIVGTNGLDLDTFQYDTDQSFAMFFLDADRTIYGRFGTRSHRTDWVGDVSIKGMAAALEKVLELHAGDAASKDALAAKRGEPLEFASPEKYPALRDKYTDQLNYEGDVVRSCIHCHQIGDARREYYWHQRKPIPDELLFPYPHPKSVGLILDPNYCARVKATIEGSPAEAAGIKPGDDLISINGQPPVSMADVQWVLHHIDSEGGDVDVRVARNGNEESLTLKLGEGWRREDRINWRVSSWLMCRIALGGMRLEAIDGDERAEMSLPDGMALRVRSAGKYGPHSTARKAGLRPDDIIVEFDGLQSFERESQVFAHVNSNRKIGDKVTVRFLRDGKEQSASFKIQK